MKIRLTLVGEAPPCSVDLGRPSFRAGSFREARRNELTFAWYGQAQLAHQGPMLMAENDEAQGAQCRSRASILTDPFQEVVLLSGSGDGTSADNSAVGVNEEPIDTLLARSLAKDVFNLILMEG